MRKLVLTLCLLAIPAAADSVYTFTVSDAVSASSLAGSITGWGYTIHNESDSLWLVTTALSSGSFQYATPTLLFDFPDLAPGATVTGPFDPLTSTGLFQIIWNAPPAGFANSGTFNLSAEWWNGDPLAGGAFVSASPDATEPYVAVATPEPFTAGLLLIAVGIGAVFSRKRSLKCRRTA